MVVRVKSGVNKGIEGIFESRNSDRLSTEGVDVKKKEKDR